MKKYLLLPTVCLFLFFTITEAQELKTNDQHKGVIEFENGYKIFPENRLNNGLYNKNNQFLFSIKNKAIVNVFDYQNGRFLILKNLENKPEILYQNPNSSFESKFIAPKYILLKTEIKKSLFYYDGKEIIKKNLPYRSAEGFIHNQKDVLAFYRIIEYKPRKTKEEKDSYSFKIGFLKDGADRSVSHLKIFQDTQPILFLSWEKTDQLNVVLSNQKKFKISIP